MVSEHLTGYAIELKKLCATDVEQVFHWRNLPEIRSRMVSDSVIELDTHRKWFDKMLSCNTQAHYKIIYKGEALGVINLKSELPLTQTDIAEIGIYIADEKFKGNLLAFAPSLLLIDYAFETLDISKLCSVVRAENKEALRYNEVLGYQVVETLNNNQVKIELDATAYGRATQQIKTFLSRS